MFCLKFNFHKKILSFVAEPNSINPISKNLFKQNVFSWTSCTMDSKFVSIVKWLVSLWQCTLTHIECWVKMNNFRHMAILCELKRKKSISECDNGIEIINHHWKRTKLQIKGDKSEKTKAFVWILLLFSVHSFEILPLVLPKAALHNSC